MSESNTDYAKLLGSGAGLMEFLDALGKFDKDFCEAMAKGHDYTIRIEVHGNKGKLLHARCQSDSFRRPDGVEKEIAKKTRR